MHVFLIMRNTIPSRAGLPGLLVLALMLMSTPAAAQSGAPTNLLYVAGIPIDFILFALTLLGVALFHHQTLRVALTGLAAITA